MRSDKSSPPSREGRLRIRMALFWGMFGGLAVIAATIALTGSYQVIAEPTVSACRDGTASAVRLMKTSPPARWWRLRHVAIPDLERGLATGSFEQTTVDYSWTHGHGAGDVFLHLDGRGRCDLTLKRRRPDAIETYHAEISRERTQEILSTIVRTKFLRLLPEETGYLVMGLGRYSVTVTVNGKSRTLIYDGMQTVDDIEAFEQVRKAILSLHKELGVDFNWQAFGYTTAG